MGFNASPKRYAFIFDDPGDKEHFGLEFRARAIEIGQYTEIFRYMTEIMTMQVGPVPTEEQLSKALHLYELFAPYLIDWNMEVEVLITPAGPGQTAVYGMEPLPATLEGLQRLSLELSMFIVTSWIERVIGVAAPLGRSLSSGMTSLTESLPMETSSGSQGS